MCRERKIILARCPGLANLATRRIMKYGNREIKSIYAYKTWRFITAAYLLYGWNKRTAHKLRHFMRYSAKNLNV